MACPYVLALPRCHRILNCYSFCDFTWFYVVCKINRPQGCFWLCSVHHLYNTSQHSCLIMVNESSPLCWWHSTIHFFCITTTVSYLQHLILLDLQPSLSTYLKLNLCSLVFLNKYIKSPTLLSLFLPHITHTDYVLNLGFIFDSSLIFYKQISSLYLWSQSQYTLSNSKQHLL